MSARDHDAATVLRVAVPGPIDRLFDYLPPDGIQADAVLPGSRVLVPFGRKRLTGVLVETASGSELATDRLRRAEAVLDNDPALPADLLALGLWAAAYYHHPPGEVLATLLPVALRRGETPTTEPPPRWRITADGRDALQAGIAGAPVQARLLDLIAAHTDGIEASALRTVSDRYHSPVRALERKGLVEPAPPAVGESPPPAPGPGLSDAQHRAAATVIDALEVFRPILLRGVTGSGKTEVYLEAMRRVVDAGRQVLVLVPEIGLTPQLLARVARRLGTTPAVLHSGLNERERLAEWRRAASGDAAVVLGTRSAVFTPLARPGLIVVDEEHDPSLKQQDGFRYHGRDLAIVRAQRAGIPIVLGSATPSLETLANARRGYYTRVDLNERAGGATPPRLELVDVRRRRLTEGLSAPLTEAMEATLADDGQVLLFLNRRGWAPTLICDDCGWTAECARCDARLTVHQQRCRLRCHHCGADRGVPTACPDCGSEALLYLGQGTERVEEALTGRFPAAPTERLDRDSVRRRGELDTRLERIRSGEARILLGTQMLAKGHDFPGVTLVGVLDADRGLFGADFRAAERLAQTVLQVAGRAGRGDRPGRVLIQTRNPEHPLLRSLVAEGYDALAERLLDEREEARLPPAARMALIRAESTQPEAAAACLRAAATELGDPPPADLEVFGPAPAPMERIAGRYRAQLALQSPTRRPLHR
ncbi:MAG: primosomal protein N', partial [Halofilum sp. (in: g-proteobacteria)]